MNNIDRKLNYMNRMTNTDSPEAECETLAIGDKGIVARLQEGNVVVFNRDGTELFRFNSEACPFKEQPIRFLVEIYTIGYNKGRMIGREVLRARIYETLGPEL